MKIVEKVVNTKVKSVVKSSPPHTLEGWSSASAQRTVSTVYVLWSIIVWPGYITRIVYIVQVEFKYRASRT